MSFGGPLVLYRGETLFADVVKSLRDHVWLIAPVEAYVIFVCGIATLVGKPNSFSLLSYEPAFIAGLPVVCTGFLAGRMAYVMLAKRPARLTHAIIDDLLHNCLTRERLLNALPIFLALPL